MSVSAETARQDLAARWDGAAAARPGFLEEAPPVWGKLNSLQRLAAPWRTRAQLARMERRPRAVGESFHFSVIGDAEPGRFWFSRWLFNKPGVFWNQLARADGSGGDFIIQLGDMVSRGLISNFKKFFRSLISTSPATPYLTVIGNHDRHAPHGVSNDRVYRAVFGETNYTFDRAGWRFVVVDTSSRMLTPAQIAWLKSVIDSARRTVVFTHVPPAPLGEWTNFGPFKGVGGFQAGAEEFMRLMSERKVSRVYMGHVHGLGLLVRGGVTYVLSGGGGSPLFPIPLKNRFHHWLSVEAGPNGLSETVHAADGSSFPLR